MAGLNFKITGDNEDLKQKLQESRQAIINSGAEAAKQGGKIDSMFKTAVSSMAMLGSGIALKSLATDIIKVRGEFQQLEIAFTTMLKSKERSDALMKDLTQFAATTPFDLKGVASGAKQLLAYGFQAEEMRQNLSMLGNIASGVGSQLGDVIYLYGTLKASGRVTQMDINQFAGRGIPIYDALAKVMKVNVDEVRSLVTAGKIGFPQVEKAFQNLTTQGGMFYNLMQNQSKSFQGQLSNLGDNVDAVFNKLGKASEEEISGAIGLVSSLVENYETVGKVILEVAAIYGTYKAAIIAVNAVKAIQREIEVQQMLANIGNTTATMAQVVANEVNTVSTVKLSAAEGLAAAIKSRLTAAQTALNASMLANPYVLAGVAIVGLVAALVIFNDTTTDAEKAQKAYNDEMDRVHQNLDIQRNKTNELISVLRDETRTIYDKIKAYNTLRTLMPERLKNLSLEQWMLKSIAEQNREIALGEKARLERALKTNTELARLEYEKRKNEYETLPVDEYYAENEKHAKSRMEQARKYYELMRKGEAKILSDAQKKEAQIEKTKPHNEKYWSDLKSDGENVIKSIDSAILSKLKKGITTGIDKNIVQSYKQAVSDIKKAESHLGVYNKTEKNHRSTPNQYVQEQKTENLADKLNNERIKAELERSQRETDFIDNEYEKKKAVIDANHKKELADITRREEERLKLLKEIERKEWEKKNPKWKDPKWSKENPFKSKYDNISSLPEEDKAGFEKDRALADKAQKKETEELYNTLIGQYQSYEDKRVAIKKETDAVLAQLDKDRAEAVKSNDTAKISQIDVAKPKVIAEGGKALMSLDYEQLKQTPEYVRAFENLEQTSSETLNSLLAKLEGAKGEAAKVLSPDQLREYTTTIQSVMDELEQRNPFAMLAQHKEELAQAEEELALATTDLNKAKNDLKDVKGGGKVESGVSTSLNKSTGKIEVTKTYLSEAQAADKVRAATEKYNATKDKSTKASAKVKVSEKVVTEQISELGSKIKEVGDAIGGQAGAIIGMIGDIGTFAMFAVGGIKQAADTSATAISTVEKASVILAIISAAIQLATKVAKLLSGDNGLEEYKRASEVYGSYINLIDKVIDKQKELMKSNTESGKQAYETAKKLLKDKENASRDIGRQNLNAGADGGFLGIGSTASNGRTTYKSISDKAWKEAAKVFNMSATAFKNKMGGRMEGLFSLSVQDIEKLSTQAMYFFGSLDKDTQSYLNNILEANKQIKEVEKERIEGLTQVSFDSVYSSSLIL